MWLLRRPEKKHRVLAFDDRLQIFSDTGEVYEALRTEPLFLQLADNWLVRRSFAVKLNRGTHLFFEQEGFDQLKDWIGLPTMAELKWAAGGHSYWQLIAGFLFLKSGLLPGLIIGSVMLLSWGISRSRPTRWLFLLYAAFFALAAFVNCRSMYFDLTAGQDISIFALCLAPFCLFGTYAHLRNFGKYRELSEPFVASQNTF